ncbi:MAG: hypothetical protein ACRED3_18545 [Bradyrhizobium sp.]
MARYQMRKHADGFAVINGVTGMIAMLNGKWLDDLDVDDASDLVDLINCIEGEMLLDADDVAEQDESLAMAAAQTVPVRRPPPVRINRRGGRAGAAGYLPWRHPA